MTSSSATPDKAQRLLDLLAFLSCHRFPVGVDQILRGVPGYARDPGSPSAESVRRKFERDKADLRDVGIEINCSRATTSGNEPEDRYQLRPDDFSLPVLRLFAEDATTGDSELVVEPEELRAALEGLTQVVDMPAFPFRRAASLALRKLTFDLADDDLVKRLPVLHLDPDAPSSVEHAMAELSDALLRRKEIKFNYYSIRRDERSPRRVQPRGLLYQGSRWYLAGWDVEREVERLFRVDRMEGIAIRFPRRRTADYDLPSGHTLKSLRERSAWELGGEEDPDEEVFVRFLPPLDLLADRNDWGERVPPDRLPDSIAADQAGDGPGVRRFAVKRRNPFLRWILSHAGGARVEAPASYVREVETLRRRTLEAHR